MSRIYDDNNRIVPVTLLKILPSKLIGKQDHKTLVVNTLHNANKPQQVALEAAKFKKGQVFTKISDTMYSEEGNLNWDMVKQGSQVRITGVSKGKGFAGVIKKHGFHRGPKSHGSDHHRAPGSIGSAYPQRVVLGKKMPGHLGTDTVTLKKALIVEIDKDNSLIAIKGAIPGPNRSYLRIYNIKQ